MSDCPTHHHFESALLEIRPEGAAVASMSTHGLSLYENRSGLVCDPGASAQRQREFLGGRHCARAALAQCGIEVGRIGVGPDRLPCWPAGFLGSITHSKGYCAAVAARRSDFYGLGLDLEKTNRLSEAAMKRVLHREELAFAGADQRLASLFFSAKEAFYKMQYPIWQTTANFHDIVLSAHQGASVLELEVIRMSDRFSEALRERPEKVRLRSRFFEDFVVSVCWMAGSGAVSPA